MFKIGYMIRVKKKTEFGQEYTNNTFCSFGDEEYPTPIAAEQALRERAEAIRTDLDPWVNPAFVVLDDDGVFLRIPYENIFDV